MKVIMITAPSSNTGKTTLTLGIIRAIRNRNLDISAFKTGPDFIDTKYLGLASGKSPGNLDMHMMGREGLKDSLMLNYGDFGLIEGAMGYFDGIFNTFENSSFHISKELDIPTILVYTPKGEMFSAIPKIQGMADFPNSKIKGIILNKTNESIYRMMKPQIEKYTDLKVLGYLPKDERLQIGSRDLGLDDSFISEKDELIELTSKLVEETIDIDEILNMAKEIDKEEYKYPKKRNIKVAIAKDDAFSFNYNENLKILEKITEVKYFSPIKDDKIPKVDLVYIGGGYPELYLKELSSNLSMLKSINDYIDGDGYLIAEGGGFMYLNKSLEGYPMVGAFDGNAYMIDRLERFGYVEMNFIEDTIYGEKGLKLKGNEYHKSRVDIEDKALFDIRKPMSKRAWKCGYSKNNVLAYYQHINFLGNMSMIENLLDEIEKDG